MAVPAPSRRAVILQAAALASLAAAGPRTFADEAVADDTAPAPPLADLVRHPLLADTLYRLPVTKDFDADGAAGTNRQGYRWIEEQRQGAEWIVRGVARQQADWIALGWRELDWGLARQAADGGFGSADPFHSTSFFVEALARSCLLDPAGATADRVRGLARAAAWLHSDAAERPGAAHNAPFTHRRYILAAALGQSARVAADDALARRARAWAEQGLSLQRDDGVNPEKGGLDAGYQMVGVLMALRYLPACDDPALRARLRGMVRRAVVPELARLRPDGSIDADGSTRIELEHARNGRLKDVPYGEVVQALVYGAQAVPEPAWLAPARRIVAARGWVRR